MMLMGCFGFVIGVAGCSGEQDSVPDQHTDQLSDDIKEGSGTDSDDLGPNETGTADRDSDESVADGHPGYDFGDEYTRRDPIVIDGNEEFHAVARAEGWAGDGSAQHPYIIEGYEIDLQNGEGGAVDVRNTDVYFVVRRCYLHGGVHKLGSAYGYGVLTWNVQNMRVERTVATDNFEGVRLEKGSKNCVIHYNGLSKNAGHGVSLASAHNNIIEYNLCTEEKDDGMLLGSFDVGDNLDASNENIVRFNEFSANSVSGVCLFRGSNNLFYGNAFGKGNMVAIINTGGANRWYSEDEKMGNWWVNFPASDADGDGILDTEKKISGGGVDRYPLAEKPQTTP